MPRRQLRSSGVLVDRYPITPFQSRLLECTARHFAAPAGLGSSKTHGIVLKAAQLSAINPGHPGFIVEPTATHVRNVLVPEFYKFANRVGGSFRHYEGKRLGVLRHSGGEFPIALFSGDRPDAVVGINAAWGLVDEAGAQKGRLLEQARERVRVRDAPLLQYGELGVPQGFDEFYAFAEGNPPDDFELIRGRTEDNPFLDEGYVPNLLSRFSEAEAQQYMRGHFVSRHGVVYTYFDPDRHVRPCRKRLRGEVVIGADFGTRTCAWSLGTVAPAPGNPSEEVLHIWGEVVGRGTDTWEQLARTKEALARMWLEETGDHESWDEIARHVTVHCDAAGKHSMYGSGALETDVEILAEAGLTVDYPRKNPPVMDRVYSLQDRLRRDLFAIDEDAAPYHARCLRQQGYDRFGRPEKSKDNTTGDAGLDHGNDDLGYICHSRWPVQAPGGNAGVRFRT